MGREAARVFVCFSCFVFLFPLFRFAATLFLERPGVVSLTRRVKGLTQPLARVRARGAHFWAGAMDAPFLGFCRHLLLPVGPGTHGRPASRAFCVGRGPFACPLTGPFHTARFFPPQVFFFFFLPLGPRLPWIACWSLAFCFAFIPRGAAEWLARVDCIYIPCTEGRIPRAVRA